MTVPGRGCVKTQAGPRVRETRPFRSRCIGLAALGEGSSDARKPDILAFSHSLGRLREIANGCFVEAKHEGAVAACRTAVEKPEGQIWVGLRPPPAPSVEARCRSGCGHNRTVDKVLEIVNNR